VQAKVVLITGGAKRVGAAICRRLHAAGANLMLHYRASAGEARLLQAELNHTRANSVALIQADLLDTVKLPSVVEQTVQTFGRLDGLVNNASSFFQTPVGEITVEGWSDLIGTNLQAPLFLAQAAAPALRKAQGAIVNIVTPHGTNAYHGSGFWFHQDSYNLDSLNNREKASGQLKPNRNLYNVYGGTFGGPLPLPRFGADAPLSNNVFLSGHGIAMTHLLQTPHFPPSLRRTR